MSRVGALKIINQRARKSGLPAEIRAHSFRGTGITEYLRNGGDLEVVARRAGHQSTRTTQLYNRPRKQLQAQDSEEASNYPTTERSSAEDRPLRSGRNS